MPLFPSLEELYLLNTSSKPLLQTIMLVNSVGPSTSSNFSTPLSKLKSLRLYRIADLESLPAERMRNLTSLVYLTIQICDKLDFLTDDVQWHSLQSLYSLQLFNLPKLVSLPKGFQYLTSLQKLTISYCDQFESPSSEDDDDMPWQGFRSLQSLTIEQLPKLVSLPKGLQYVTTLRDLYIDDCDQFESPSSEDDDDMPWQGFRSLQSLYIHGLPKLVSLPKGLQYVTTLRDLTIEYCHNLTALPEWISNSSSLSRLEIYNCPKLSERCGNNIGMDWPKIAHIPNIQIDRKWIQIDHKYSSSTGIA
ncbi:putative disease resistance protein RGA4 isoform X1 [Pistacia vera]|uniref:putative disease resistance protein RGA4 isoform X1 n=1 Tax=Pistacia vera TaxID=55513 RepID=UPI001262C45E|nr:putative disease resistance protein RGA4 isoform X1 [Pistacia vera]XP_031272756.1 putative disease resistance protein RGA4 isoform X1 [Pistacia vera]